MSLSFLAAAREIPEAVAVVTADRSFSFAELAPQVASLAAELATAAGGTTPRWLALEGSATLATLVHLYAAFEVGVPVALLHPRWTAGERDRAMAVLAGALDAASLSVPPSGKTPPGAAVPCDDRPLATVFTSGSVTAPKGAVLSRRAACAAAQASAARLGWFPEDRWLLSLSPAHVGGLAIVVRCLVARKAVVVAEGGDAAGMLATIRRHRVTLLSVVAAQLRRLLDADGEAAPSSLRAVLVGGGPCAPPLLREAVARGWPVLPTYGLTEAGSQVATAQPGWRPADGLALPPLAGVAVRIVDGEVQIRSDALCSAVLPAGEVPAPFTADGWLRTGDLGRLHPGGKLEVVGRRDTVIVSGGEKVVPEEVEAALLELPQVREALVFGVEDPVWGALVTAAVVPSAGARLSPRALREALGGRLAPFKIPRRIVVVDELPRLPGGKVDRQGAARRLQAGGGGRAGHGADHGDA